MGGGGGTCHVTYTKSSEWTGGFVANLTLANTGTSAISPWTLTYSFPGDQKISNAWNATVTQTGAAVSATGLSFDSSIAPGGTVTFGYQGTWVTNDNVPTAFSINGSACN
jgi:cellulase/cellobiase CelA1